MENEVKATRVMTFVEKRAEIKMVIVKCDPALVHRRVPAVRRGYCHNLRNDEGKGKGFHGCRTFRVSSETVLSELSTPFCEWYLCLRKPTCCVSLKATGPRSSEPRPCTGSFAPPHRLLREACEAPAPFHFVVLHAMPLQHVL